MSAEHALTGQGSLERGAGRVIGVGYVRIPAADLQGLAEFYKATFGMQQIGAILDHAIILNVGATVAEALANANPRVIVDRRMKSNREYGPNDNNCWVFMTKGIEQVMRRAEKSGATVVMEPYPPVSRMGMVVGKFRDPSGNQIELTEVGTDNELYLRDGENQQP
jgi:predicted enzyme related to lactoylglutathione lyase